MGDGDASFLINHLGQHFAQHVDGIGHGSAEVTGMEVAVGAGHLNFPVGQSAQPCGQGGQVGGEHGGVAHQDDVAAQQFAVLLQESVERGRSDFLFTFQNELHVVAQQAVRHQELKGFELHKALSFIIVGTACIDASVAHFGFKGLRSPLFERCHGHHVVVAVHQHGRCVIVHFLFGKDQRITLRRHHFGVIRSGCQQQFAPPFGAAQAVGMVFGLRADARDAEQGKKLFEETLLIVLEKSGKHGIRILKG